MNENRESNDIQLPESEGSDSVTIITESYDDDEKPRRSRFWLWWLLWTISMVITGVIAFFVGRLGGRSESGTLSDALRIIREGFYFYEKEEDHLIDGAIAGMVDSLGDIYSEYYTEEEYAALTKSQSGYYTGVGILLEQRAIGDFAIIRVYENTPAFDAGILAGDALLSINGTPADGMEIGAFLDCMKTEEGDENVLVLRRNDTEMTVTVTARTIYAATVTYRMQTDSIGYLHLSGFHGDCVTEVKEAIEAMREQGMESLILDLRDKPGGSLYDACDIADLFLPKGLVITSLRTKDGSSVEYKTEKEGYTFPVVLLVNQDSASASELVSGALQDHGRVRVVGTQTYGKGIVQSYCYVPGTRGYIKITTEAYYTPSGVCIHGVGITPDTVVENPEEAQPYSPPQIPEELDAQRNAAILLLQSE